MRGNMTWKRIALVSSLVLYMAGHSGGLENHFLLFLVLIFLLCIIFL